MGDGNPLVGTAARNPVTLLVLSITPFSSLAPMPSLDAELSAQAIGNLPQPRAPHLADILFCIDFVYLALLLPIKCSTKGLIGAELRQRRA
jgi:hypothetical protein